tara:strand:+ start:15 stop:1385 length:1371 start_codon:yes stop_codon:yes gene_type:complete
MSKLLTNQISNYNDNGPVEVKDGVNIPTGKPLQVAGTNGTSGQYLTSTGSSIAWSTFPNIPAAQVQSDWNASGTLAAILNKPTLATVATSGSYNDLTNKPTIPAAQIQSDWSQSNSVALDFIKNKPTIPAVQVQSNWNENDSNLLSFIQNKPTLFSGAYADLTGKPTLFSGSWNDLTNKPTLFSGAYADLTGKPTLVTALNDLSDVDTSGLSNNKILKYNGSSWVIADDASGGGGADGNTTYSQAVVSDSSNVKLRLTGSDSTDDDILITAGTNISISNVSTEGFTLSSTASSGASVTTSDSAPGSPNDGDLWWKSDEGRLKVYYQDADSSQWVDASPPVSSGPRYKGTAAFTNFGTNPQGTWTGAGITATYGAISNPSGYGSFQFTFTMAHNYGDTDSYLILAQGHFNNDSTAGRGAPLVVNMEKVNGTTFIGTVADPTSNVIDDAKFDLFVFDA